MVTEGVPINNTLSLVESSLFVLHQIVSCLIFIRLCRVPCLPLPESCPVVFCLITQGLGFGFRV